jgi:tetratricopeptide (TPR) repeat protein
MIHPVRLACLYPNPVNYLPFWQVGGALALVLAVSWTVFLFRKSRPYLLTGWFWNLGMLVPVIGVVQISYYAHADRYTYLPQIGLDLALTWLAADLCAGWRWRRVVLGCGAAIILVPLIFCARTQTSFWRNGESLWAHALACTSGNFIAHNNLGFALTQEGKVDEGIAQYQMALQIEPDYVDAHNNLALALLKIGRVDEAIAQCRKAVQINPYYALSRNNLGYAFITKGNMDEAIVQCQKAVQLDPLYLQAYNNLAFALLQKGRVDEAIVQCQKAVQLNPDNATVHYDLGLALLQKGNTEAAIVECQKAVQLDPRSAAASFNLGLVYYQKGDLDQAAVHYQRALEIMPDYLDAHINLANVLRQKGATDEAMVHYQKALELARTDGRPDLVEQLIRQLISLQGGVQPLEQSGKKSKTPEN